VQQKRMKERLVPPQRQAQPGLVGAAWLTS